MITRYKAADPLDPTSQAEYKVLAAGAQRYWHGTRAAFEQVKNSIPNNTMICITDDNDAPSDNAPIGSVFAYYGSTSPDGYLICDGSTFDTSLYPDLYLFLGSDILPDLRECTLVGVGQNTTHTIAAHDEYTLGQFKDDQLQGHEHKENLHGGSGSYVGGTVNSSSTSYNTLGIVADATHGTPRVGTTTHGKQVGVNYIIKATSNMSKSDASALLAQVIQHMTLDYANAETLTAAQLVSGYTCTKRGVVFLAGYATSTDVNVTVNSVRIGSFWSIYSNVSRPNSISAPLSIGDVLAVGGSASNITGGFTFVPYK